MGCEGGVTIYDARKIEEHFGPDVWNRSGWGHEHSMPLVEIGAERVLVTDWNTGGGDREDNFEAAREEQCQIDAGHDPDRWAAWSIFLGKDADKGFAREVALWAVDNALIANVETWT
jgi:hypothetical protein